MTPYHKALELLAQIGVEKSRLDGKLRLLAHLDPDKTTWGLTADLTHILEALEEINLAFASEVQIG